MGAGERAGSGGAATPAEQGGTNSREMPATTTSSSDPARTRLVRALSVHAASALALFILGLLVGLLLVGLHGNGAVQPLDDRVGRYLLAHRAPLVGVSRFVATWLDAAPLFGICLVASALWWYLRRVPIALAPLLAYLGGEGEVFAIRQVIHRHRPPTADYPAPGSLPGVHETSWSFPSGHSVAVTAVLIAVALAAALARRRRGAVTLVLATLASLFVAGTRLVLGVHYLSDVVVGLLLGAAWGATVATVLSRLERFDLAGALGSRRRARGTETT
jgi:membrane-associated phospholipid phosphatase